MIFKKLQQYSFLLLLVMISVAFLYVIHGFLMPVFWAIVFAILFHPIYEKILLRLKGPGISSFATLILIILICFIPLFLISGVVFKESISVYQQLSASSIPSDVLLSVFDKLGDAVTYLERVGITEVHVKEKFLLFVEESSQWIASQAVAFGQSTFLISLKFFLMLYILFFLLKDGLEVEKKLIQVLPLGNRREKRLFKKFTSTTRAVIKGTFIVGIVQGIAGAVLFMVAGINGAILWGVLMMVLSVIPALGTGLIWFPAGIILIFTSSVWQGIVVLVGGFLIVGLIDNILRPMLVGKDTKMPDMVILISTLGGLSVFGIAGFVIGPVVAGFFIVMWDMFEKEYHNDLLNN